MGHFYSPFIVPLNPIKVSPPICSTCKAALNPYASKNRQTRTWNCNFCGAVNPLTAEIGNAAVEEYVDAKAGENGVFFIIDLCISEDDMVGLKETLIKTIQKLPRNIYAGLISFNRNVFLHQFSSPNSKVIAFNGSEGIFVYKLDYSLNNYARIK